MEYNFDELNMSQMKILLERYNGQLKSKRKYYEKNKAVINEYAKNYIVDRYNTDPEFKEKQKEYARKAYEKKRLKKLIEGLNNEEALFDINEELKLIIK
jgi:DNA-nicking Smr family endonuclease